MLLFDLLNELGKSDRMRSLLSIVSLFRNEFNKYNDTGTRMFDFIYVKSFEFVFKSHFWVRQKLLKTSSHNVICKPLMFYRL